MATAYPKVTSKAWATLRARAAAAPTTEFVPSTVAPLLGLSSPKSARDNTVTPLQKLGLIDDEGALTDRGNKWRVDASYAEACQEILDDVYPNELSALTTPDGDPDPQTVRTWFDQRGFGASNARQMAATYVMIASKEIPEPPDPASSEVKKTRKRQGTAEKPKKAEPEKRPSKTEPPPSPPSRTSTNAPTVHIDLQIHIPGDATPEQIDHIFASMAKHLYPT